ncbi:MAG: CRTAC1 family protein, partial [Candidatus Coatesbacteria bacterium]
MKTIAIIAIICLFVPSVHVYGVFTDVTESALGDPGPDVPGRCITWPDYNNDGRPDLFMGDDVLYENNGDGTFTRVTDIGLDAPFSDYRATWADADNDGDLDCYQSSFRITDPDGDTVWDTYFENEGAPDYTFTGYDNYVHPGYSRGGQGCFVDTDGDSYYELYEGTFGNWDPYGGAFPDKFFEADGAEAWTDVTGTYIPQLDTNDYKRHVRGVSPCDYDNDFDMDIFVPVYAVDWGDPSWENYLWLNDGTGNFTDYAEEAGVEVEPHGRYGVGLASGASWGDYDNDGYMDLCVGNIHGWAALYHNERDGTFTNVTEEAGLYPVRKEWHSPNWLDFDNDGDLDLVIWQWYEFRGFFFENEGPENLGHFDEVTTELGLSAVFFSNIYSLACADYDGDGDMDFAMNRGGGYAGRYLLRNDTDRGNHWLVFELEGDGTTCGLTAHGAKVRVRLGDGSIMTRQVEPTSADAGMNMIPVHFGLGDNTSIDYVQVFWLCGYQEYWDFADIGGSVDRYITLVEGTGTESTDVELTYFEAKSAENGIALTWDVGISGNEHI